MSIAKLKPDQPKPSSSIQTITAPHASIFTSVVPETRVNSLLKYVEGYPWTCDYYSQILSTNNTIQNFDPTTPNLTQPYMCVKSLILQVSSPLSYSYDEKEGISSLDGTAITPLGLIPNQGDVFIAKVDSGEDAIFHITAAIRKTHRTHTLYEITYSLYAYVSAMPSYLESLNKRIQDTYYFNKDTDYFNRNVLIKPSVKEAIDKLKVFLYESVEHYFSRYSSPVGGILMPTDTPNRYILDSYLVEFIQKTVATEHYAHRWIKTPSSVANIKVYTSIYDALLSRSLATLSITHRHYMITSRSVLPSYIRIGTVQHSGYTDIVHPVIPNIAPTYAVPNIPTTITIDIDNYTTRTLLHSVFSENSYVVSDNFYEYALDTTIPTSISYIEYIIYKFIAREAIAREDLVLCIQDYHMWSKLEQFYLLPVMWLIVNTYVR